MNLAWLVVGTVAVVVVVGMFGVVYLAAAAVDWAADQLCDD